MIHKKLLKKVADFVLARSLSGGLEINDTGLRFVSAEGSTLRTAGVRLAPGIMTEGRVEDKKELIAALRQLRAQILGAKAKRRSLVNVAVSLSSVNIYTQVFKLPFIEGANLEKAIQLNIQMASPSGAAADTYAGWQTMGGKDESDMHLEVVTAFLPKGVADNLTEVLHAGGFLPIALESRALSLARLIKNKAAGINSEGSLIAVSADASGLDVMIVRNGHLHFDYFNSWKDLQGSERQISMDLFSSLIVRGVNQVMNFYTSHWSDPISEIVVASTGLKEEVLAAIRENFNIKVSELTPAISPPLTPEWYVALGGALRSLKPRREDEEISLLGVSAQEEFRREQTRNFLDFWRVLIPAALTVLLAAFVVGWMFLNTYEEDFASRAQAVRSLPASAEFRELQLQARDFNASIAMLKFANSTQMPKTEIFSKLTEIVERRGIGVERLILGDITDRVTMTGVAASENDIIAFKNELEAAPEFKSIDLPLTGIRQRNADYSFSVTFIASP